LPTLKRQIAESQKRRLLDRDAVEELATAVARREVRSARGDDSARRVLSLGNCASPLRVVLEHRAEEPDAIGAAAMLVLLEADLVDASPLVERFAEASDAWRAVAARAAAAPEHAAVRRRWFLDPDERVRRAALRAANEAADPADLNGLLDAARRDPDPMSRTLAIRASGTIGGERAVLALRDRWARADSAIRIAIIDAWAQRRAFDAGGERQLTWVIESESGPEAVAAAATLLRSRSDAREVALAVLVRSIAAGTQLERRAAIHLAPIEEPSISKRIEAAAEDVDAAVRVAALGRLALLDDARRRDKAVLRLRKLAKGEGAIALEARAALATAGDVSVTDMLQKQLASRSSEERRRAAIALLELGDYARAATALGDDDPGVRASVACSVLADER
jgi:hypothetical protein